MSKKDRTPAERVADMNKAIEEMKAKRLAKKAAKDAKKRGK